MFVIVLVVLLDDDEPLIVQIAYMLDLTSTGRPSLKKEKPESVEFVDDCVHFRFLMAC